MKPWPVASRLALSVVVERVAAVGVWRRYEPDVGDAQDQPGHRDRDQQPRGSAACGPTSGSPAGARAVDQRGDLSHASSTGSGGWPLAMLISELSQPGGQGQRRGLGPVDAVGTVGQAHLPLGQRAHVAVEIEDCGPRLGGHHLADQLVEPVHPVRVLLGERALEALGDPDRM